MWIRRPDGLRVEALDGSLVQAERQEVSEPLTLTTPARPGEFEAPWPLAAEVQPIVDADGLVRRRPTEWEAQYDDPFLQDYRWIAALDPVELADGHGRWLPDPEKHPVVVEQVRRVDHRGREAWEAVCHPTPSCDPRRSCCPLLFSAESEAREAQGEPTADDRTPGLRYPEAHRIVLDVGTGVCVRSEEVGGSTPGGGHELVIEAVDEPMPDDLFGGFLQ